MNILLNCILDRPAKPLCSRKADLTSVSNWGGYCEASENQQDRLNNERISQLIASQAAEIERLRAENERLQSQIDKMGGYQPQPQVNLRKLTPKLKRRIAHKLEDVAFPVDIIRQLNAHNIFKVSDLIQQSETDLSQFDGLTPKHIDKIRQHLSYMRLQLGTDILYVDALGDYYLKETKTI